MTDHDRYEAARRAVFGTPPLPPVEKGKNEMSFITDLIAKNFLKSKGFWGVVGMALPSALEIIGRATGWHIKPEDVGAVSQLGIAAWQVTMGALALWGRWTAKGPLTTGPDKIITVEATAPAGQGTK